jgi:hypothetical protein
MILGLPLDGGNIAGGYQPPTMLNINQVGNLIDTPTNRMMRDY